MSPVFPRSAALVICAFCCLCCTRVETVGVADTAAMEDSTDTGSSTDTNEDTGSATDTSDDTATETEGPYEPPPFTRMPYMPADNATDDYLWVEASTNPLGMQGLWYDYADGGSSSTIRNADNGVLCASGHVERYIGEGWTLAGMGFSMCNNGSQYEPIWQVNPIGSCPFVPDLAQRLIGVSFALVGEFPDTLHVHFLEASRVHPPSIPVTTADKQDYFIADAEGRLGDPPLDINNVEAIQFQVEHSEDENINFDFCVTNVELLIAD